MPAVAGGDFVVMLQFRIDFLWHFGVNVFGRHVELVGNLDSGLAMNFSL